MLITAQELLNCITKLKILNTMKNQNSPSGTSFPRQKITVKKSYTLADYFDFFYTAKHYYDAMRLGASMPTKALPTLNQMLEAHAVCMAYAEAHPAPPMPLLKGLMRLDLETIVAVWLFQQKPQANVQIGDKLLMVINTSVA